jgi:hypothetical protein
VNLVTCRELFSAIFIVKNVRNVVACVIWLSYESQLEIGINGEGQR